MTENINQIEETDFDSFMKEVASAAPKQRSNDGSGNNYLNKIWTNQEKNFGKLIYVPFNSREGNKPASFFNDVHQVRVNLDGSTYPTWHRILTIDQYKLTDPAEQALYSEVISYISSISAKGIMPNDAKINGRYGCLFGHIISHQLNGKEVETSKGASFICYPSANFSKVFNTCYNDTLIKIANNVNTLRSIFNRNKENRPAYLTTNFGRAAIGYEVSCTIDFSNALAPVVPQIIEMSDNLLDQMDSHSRAFIGKNSGTDRLFNPEYFIKLRDYLKGVLASAPILAVQPQTPAPVVNNNVAIDPLAGLNVQTPITSVASAPIAAPMAVPPSPIQAPPMPPAVPAPPTA